MGVGDHVQEVAMSAIAIPGGWFQSEPMHAYFAEDKVWVPSLTQCLRLQGLVDYSGVDSDTLENAARRGTAVHQLAAALNKHGDVDPTWVTEELHPYFEAYLRFLSESDFRVDPAWCEQPFIAAIHGFRVGITPDCFGWFGKTPGIVELKATAVEMPSWSIQTALQEAGIYKSNRCGRARRHALMLMKTGKYKLLSAYTNHEEDLAAGVAALRLVWWRIAQGQRVWEQLG
jgi:hypothetical protein